MKTNLKNQKGITLVALVVTIIVLLILAGVSLSLVAGGNGIINKSSKAADKTNDASAREMTELKLAELVADYYEDKFVNGNAELNTKTQRDYIALKATLTDSGGVFSGGAVAGEYLIGVKASDGELKVVRAKNNTVVATGSVSTEGKIDSWVPKTSNNGATNTTNTTP